MKPERVAKYKKMLYSIQWTAMKSKSNAFDAGLDRGFRDAADMELLNSLDRGLFDDKYDLNVLTVTQKYLDKLRDTGHLDPGDVYNFLYIANRSLIVKFCFAFFSSFLGELPDPMEEMMKCMKDEFDEE